ncbi:DinB family protein [Roseivirga sp.]|uniref:DinB family protein n=1 Tax=Roseivirga sp. TaxID=1964215 RepID=UPI003B8C11BA
MNMDYNLREITLAAFEQFMTTDKQDAEKRPGHGKWSAKEIMGHLIDSAMNNHGRFVRAQDTDDLIGQGYDQDAWVIAQNYQAMDWDDIIILWRQLNMHMAYIIEQTPDDVRDLKRSNHNLHQIAFNTVPEDQPTTLAYFMEDYVLHVKHHLGQVRSALSMEDEA